MYLTVDCTLKVHAEPRELLELYREVGGVPDVWSLAEWSDWLTPTDLHEQGTRRDAAA
jgi:hypothetical protein